MRLISVAYIAGAWLVAMNAAAFGQLDFSNNVDKSADGAGGLSGASAQQVLVTSPPDASGGPMPSNGVNYGRSTTDVDAIASEHDLRSPDGLPLPPPAVIPGDLLVSFIVDPAANAVHFESTTGSTGVRWTQVDFANPGGVDDVDGLQTTNFSPSLYFSEIGDVTSLATPGDPASATSVWFSPAPGVATPSVFITHAQIVTAVTALGYTGPASAVDVDAMMIADSGAWGMWGDPGDQILFSIRDTTGAGGNFDGGELIVWDMIDATPFQFLVHGGHTWDTAFNVAVTFGVGTEEVDALEQVAGACCLGAVGGGCGNTTAGKCSALNGRYFSDKTCAQIFCVPVPTVSEWGLVVMTLLLMVVGTVVLARRRGGATQVA